MQRAVKTLQHFDFRSDFSTEPAPLPPPTPEEEGKIVLLAADLAMLLSEARSEGLAAGLSQVNEQAHGRIQDVTHTLSLALSDLVALAGHLEASAYDQDFKDRTLSLITATARRIADGQGDLFAESRELAQNAPFDGKETP